MHDILLIIGIGLLSGFLGSTVGGGGMIAIPSLLLLGIPPQVAIASKKVGDVGAFLVACREYWKSNLIDWSAAKWLVILAIIGSLIGTQLMIYASSDNLIKVVVILILVFLPFTFLIKNMGTKKRKVSKAFLITGSIFYFLMAIANSMTGAGGATVVLFIMVYFFGYRMVRGYATNIPSELIFSVLPAVIYSFHGFIDIRIAGFLFLGSVVGGYIGSKLAIKKGDTWVRGLFFIIVVAMLLKLLFF